MVGLMNPEHYRVHQTLIKPRTVRSARVLLCHAPRPGPNDADAAELAPTYESLAAERRDAWFADLLPERGGLAFDLILFSAVWMHVAPPAGAGRRVVDADGDRAHRRRRGRHRALRPARVVPRCR
jgi:hypothetical protein